MIFVLFCPVRNHGFAYLFSQYLKAIRVIGDYTVPGGMKIGDGDYTSLKVGDVIMIMFDREGGISEIMVMPSENSAEETTAE